jgi:hypothetical protein
MLSLLSLHPGFPGSDLSLQFQQRPEVEQGPSQGLLRTNSTPSLQTWKSEFSEIPSNKATFLPSMMSDYPNISMVPGLSHFNNFPSPMAAQQNFDPLQGKMVELDDEKWEEQFRAFEENIKDDEANKAIEDELNMQESQQFFGDFESIWNGIKEEEAQKLVSGDYDILDTMRDGVPDSTDIFDGHPDLGDYLFEPDNHYMNHPNPFEEGMNIINEGGSLSEAALCFEAACQTCPTRVDGWSMLGTVQAQNEKELAAIRALEQALRLDNTNLSALMVYLLNL